MLAEVGGEVRPALSLSDRSAIADPFYATAPLVQLLLKRTEQVLGDRSPRLQRLRRRRRLFRRLKDVWEELDYAQRRMFEIQTGLSVTGR